MISWKNIDHERPKIGEEVLIYCPELKFPYDIMKYKGEAVIYEDDRTMLVGQDSFVNKTGFLTDDVTHWSRLEKPQCYIPVESRDITEIHDIELAAPLNICAYQEDDGTYRAEFDLCYGVGDSIDEAIDMVKRELYTLKHDLNEQFDNLENGRALEMREWLNDIIRE